VPVDGQPRLIELSRGGNRMRMGIPFSPGAAGALAPDCTLIHAWTGEFRRMVSRRGRDTVQVFGRRWAPVAISEARRQASFEPLEKVLGREWGGGGGWRALRLAA